MVLYEKIKKYAAVLILLTALQVLMALISVWADEGSLADKLAIRITGTEGEEIISAWEGDNHELFFFLPAYADPESLQIIMDYQDAVCLNGEMLTNGVECGEIRLNETYRLTYTRGRREYETTLTFLRSDNLPAMYIDTESGGMDYVHADKDNAEAAIMRLYLTDGTVDYAGGLKSIRGRGNATWQHEKKPYNFSLLQEAELLGMGRAVKWVLLANASDSSNIRNKLVLDCAQQFGLEYPPDSEWVDLYLNGDYRGVYLLCEPNEIHEQRIDIGTEQTFLVSLETESNMLAQNLPYIKTESGQCIRIRESALNRDLLLKIWQSMEDAVFAADGVDKNTGKHYSEILNMDSVIRKYLLEEIFGNLDGFRASCFFFFGDSGLLCADPVWDYDKAMGNARDIRYNITNPNTFVVIREEDWEGMGGQWIKQLAQKQEFSIRCYDVFETEIYPMIKQAIVKRVNEYVQHLAGSHEMNWTRWYGLDKYRPLADECNEIIRYLFDHVDFLWSVWIDKNEYATVSFLGGMNNVYYSVEPGECVEEMPVEESTETDEFLGWYYRDTDMPFDPIKPIREDTILYAKWKPTIVGEVKKTAKYSTIVLIAVMFMIIVHVDSKRTRNCCTDTNAKRVAFKRIIWRSI